MTAGSGGFSEYGEPVFRDKRRIDPETGQVREPRPAAPSPADTGTDRSGDTAGSGGSAASGGADTTTEEEVPMAAASASTASDAIELEAALAERTADLQRLQAEYVNYKRRVDRDRQVVKDNAVATVLTSLLPVLDDIGRARDHDELTGGFKAVAESFERIVSGLGLEAFGEVGDPFDPRIHEALMHQYSDDVAEPVAQAVLQVGYKLGDRIVRPARVAVVEPENVPAGASATGGEGAAAEGSGGAAEGPDEGSPVDE